MVTNQDDLLGPKDQGDQALTLRCLRTLINQHLCCIPGEVVEGEENLIPVKIVARRS